MVTAFDIIQYFSVAALFGWLTFARLTDVELKRVPKQKRKIAKKNLILINQFFIIAFLFFAISALADYVLHHLTISMGVEMLFRPTDVLVVLLVTFLTGMGMLIAPIAYIQAIGRLGKHLGSFELAPFGYTFGFLFLTTTTSLLMWTGATNSTPLFYLLLASGCVPYIGLYLALRYWYKRLSIVVGLVMILWPVYLVGGLVLLSFVIPRI